MADKNKTLIDEQSCAKCKYFLIEETDAPCTKCLKIATYSQFIVSLEEKYREEIADNPQAKIAMETVVAE
jgi:hypothetical protein